MHRISNTYKEVLYMDAIFHRTSVRKFLDKPVEKEKIEKSWELFCAPFRQRKRHNGKGSGNLEKTACIDDGRRRNGGAFGLHEGRAR